ncbi:MAG: NAD(P)-dependent glycerol-3-phosphate dehydrogenase [Thermotogae bacterium]|nr:NAD(P)-dependent glycerol-3-phosphate dehydrogenase [Thermotogota bacterium]
MAGFQKRAVGVIGGGAWGLALAHLLTENGHEVLVWDRRADRIENLKRFHRDDERLPGVQLNPKISYTYVLRDLEGLDFHVLVVKSGAVEEMLQRLREEVRPRYLVSAVKGFVGDGIKTVSMAVKEMLPSTVYAVLSGPSIALEVVRGIPTSVVVASEDINFAFEIQRIFSGGNFRVYRQRDVLGVELGGALKNVIAIAAGISDGLGFATNSKGALLTRGLREMVRFGVALGAQKDTFFGLAGMGDMITTSFSKNSRNRYVGERLGKGESIDTILDDMKMVAEGVRTAPLVFNEAKRLNVEVPITEAVVKIIEGEISPLQALEELMRRPLKDE